MNKTLQKFFQEISSCGELWRKIRGTGGKYYISSYGQIVSLTSKNPALLSPWFCDNGYLRITIKQYGKRQNLYIHRLVAQAFCDKPITAERVQVHHIDGNKRNNKAENLVFLTAKQHCALHSKVNTDHAETGKAVQ